MNENDDIMNHHQQTMTNFSTITSTIIPILVQNLNSVIDNDGVVTRKGGGFSHTIDLITNITTVTIDNLTFREPTASSSTACPSLQMPVGNVISMILYAIVCIVGLLGNTLVIYVVLRFSKMQTVTNMYILNLAIADECFLIGIPFLITTMHLGEWTFGKPMCKAYMISTSITQFTSSIFLFIMSADRYIAVCHPISSTSFRTSFVSKLVSGIAWSTTALMMIPGKYLFVLTQEILETNNI